MKLGLPGTLLSWTIWDKFFSGCRKQCQHSREGLQAPLSPYLTSTESSQISDVNPSSGSKIINCRGTKWNTIVRKWFSLQNSSTEQVYVDNNNINNNNSVIMDKINGGMKRSSSENATNATRDPETMFSNPGAGATADTVMSKPWKQRFSFRQPRKQATLEEVSFHLIWLTKN